MDFRCNTFTYNATNLPVFITYASKIFTIYTSFDTDVGTYSIGLTGTLTITAQSESIIFTIIVKHHCYLASVTAPLLSNLTYIILHP